MFTKGKKRRKKGWTSVSDTNGWMDGSCWKRTDGRTALLLLQLLLLLFQLLLLLQLQLLLQLLLLLQLSGVHQLGHVGHLLRQHQRVLQVS
jgi:hypothetical protein